MEHRDDERGKNPCSRCGMWDTPFGLNLEAAVFDHDAAIHDDADAAFFGVCRCFRVYDSLLHPKVTEAEGDHLFDDGGDGVREAEDVDDVGLDGKRRQRWIAFLAQDFGQIDGLIG